MILLHSQTSSQTTWKARGNLYLAYFATREFLSVHKLCHTSGNLLVQFEISFFLVSIIQCSLSNCRTRTPLQNMCLSDAPTPIECGRTKT